MTREERKFFQNLGLCPICHKVQLIGDEKTCPECNAKQYTYLRAFRDRNPGYDKEKRMTTYRRRIADHECTACGIKLGDSYLYKTCPKCRKRTQAINKRSRERRAV